MSIRTIGILTLLVVSLSSCWKGEEPYVLPSAGSAVQQQLVLGENYEKMVYYNVNTRTFLIQDKNSWDLGFEDGDSGLHIIVNGGKSLRVIKTGETNFFAPYTVTSTTPVFHDAPSGNLDSTAIDEWWSASNGESKKELYLVDTEPTKPVSATSKYKRLQVLSADKTGYNIRLGSLDNTTQYTDYFIPKDNKHNFTYFNLTTGETKIDMEPEKDNWDILFTKYTSDVDNQGTPQAYEVTGVLLNRNNVSAAKINQKKFEEIDINYAMSLVLSNNIEVIGYDWKSYNLSTGRYTVLPNITYVIKSNSGYYYKLRFIDYYDDKGVKGAPTFDLQRL